MTPSLTRAFLQQFKVEDSTTEKVVAKNMTTVKRFIE